MSALETFESLCRRVGRIEISEMTAFYDSLPGVACEAMLGDWEGGAFDTGHPVEGQLATMKWVGKRFDGVNEVHPIICRGEDGARVTSPVLGGATLRSVEHRGVVTATMIYDKHPIFDHFRRVGEGVVLGCMDRKGEALPLYFWLRRIQSA